ncbi:hypothetical protein GCM10009570_04130 [Dietzia natronolimnaea]
MLSGSVTLCSPASWKCSSKRPAVRVLLVDSKSRELMGVTILEHVLESGASAEMRAAPKLSQPRGESLNIPARRWRGLYSEILM